MINLNSGLSRIICALFLCTNFILFSQVQVSSGSYTTNFPGTDEAGRNGFPSGSPQLSGNAVGRPVPTNDWWSKLVKENHADNLFNYPMTMKTTNHGLIATYIPWGVIGDSAPIEIGLSGLNVSNTTVSDYSDWTVTMNWKDADNHLKITSGIGMPFLYFEKDSDDVLEIKINSGTVSILNELLIIEDASNGADFVFYAPTGSTWSEQDEIYTSSLNNETYWSMAMLPQTTTNTTQVAIDFQQYAYVFPTNTLTTWNYDKDTSILTSDFVVSTEIKEGVNTNMLLGLLPHQWNNLSQGSSNPDGPSYDGVRGELKTIVGNSFSVQNTFKGILPTLPNLVNYSDSFSPSELDSKISQIENDGLATWTDSYNEGQVMNRLIQTARIANQTGDIEARDKMIATVKERLEDWLTYDPGEVAFLFYYNDNWSAMLGYPSGHGQDTNINDHHFHWGYFIHAAAFMEQFEPGWASQWGDMINLLIRDAASSDRNDSKFPFLRNFSPYAGHSWANGFATFPQGNDQESTSESMQFASSLIHWGSITQNKDILDLGIYIYTTEQTAIEEYWFDIYKRNFQPSQQYSLVSRVWGNSYDNGTFWTSDIAASYGIELYPIHGGSLYLGHNSTYAASLWDEITLNTGILSNEVNPNLWHDTYWKFLSLIDAEAAIDLYNSNPDRNLKFGISDAQTYHWLHAMNALGPVDNLITANHPIAASFSKDGLRTYVAHNYSNSDITVSFSDGFELGVPANSMATNRDIDVSGNLTSDFTQAFPGGSVNLYTTVEGSSISKVVFYDGDALIGEDIEAPYSIKAENLSLGIHNMYAKIYVQEQFNVTNSINIQVGEQVPYLGNITSIPGIIEAAHYDQFEGGIGQNISYVDVSNNNEGGFRPEEHADAAVNNQEGAIIGWTASGEWLEYTIDVTTAGIYDLDFRYASGNSNGGGPFHFEIDGQNISSDITLSSTGDWNSWATKSVSGIELHKGEHILRLVIDNGEFNIGKMNFTYNSPLSYDPPVADAGENVSIIVPSNSGLLDGTLSNHPNGIELTYFWEQIYGPSTISFEDNSSVSPIVSNLIEGVYKCKLTVNDGTYTSSDDVLIIVSLTGNTEPSVSITSPANNSTFSEGSNIMIMASASDLEGNVSKVEFFNASNKIGEDVTEPFQFVWTEAPIGEHVLTAIATDELDTQGTSQMVNITVEEIKSCEEVSNEAQQGSFSVGYEANFETVGNSVTISFTLLDEDKSGVVAYLWRQSPFEETQLNQMSGLTFSRTLSGFTIGETINYACKFAYAGGQSVTKYISYVIGDNCDGDSGDNESPKDFTTNLGEIKSTSVELLLRATDNSGTVKFNVSYGNEELIITGDSNVQKSVIIGGLSPDTTYSFSVEASDLTGNEASTNPISLEATTLQDMNTDCYGSTFESQQGAFNLGYNYSFTTNNDEVTFTFELLDSNKTGVVAYLWRESPFQETQMDFVSGLEFSKTLTGFTSGETIRYACKFAFAGGLAVTKYFSYTVGDDCLLSVNEEKPLSLVSIHPNPTKEILYINAPNQNITKIEVYSLLGQQVLQTSTNLSEINIDALANGLYMLKMYSGTSVISKKFLKE